jgi:hypothetical protein
MNSFLSYIILALSVARANAAIGPVADLPIVNGYVTPDGFNRTYVSSITFASSWS